MLLWYKRKAHHTVPGTRACNVNENSVYDITFLNDE